MLDLDILVVEVVFSLSSSVIGVTKVVSDSFEGVTTASARDIFSVEPSEGAGEEERSSVTRGIRDVTN